MFCPYVKATWASPETLGTGLHSALVRDHLASRVSPTVRMPRLQLSQMARIEKAHPAHNAGQSY